MDFSQAITSWILDTSSFWSDDSFQGIDDFYSKYMGWTKHPLFYTTTFEKLVGPHGGGSKEEQIQEIINIARHLDHPISLERAQQIADELFGNAPTFRKGQIGAWKEYFTQEHKELFKKTAGQLLIDLGYEKDFDW